MPPVGFIPITIPIGVVETASGTFMLERFVKDQERTPQRKFALVLCPSGDAAEIWLHSSHYRGGENGNRRVAHSARVT